LAKTAVATRRATNPQVKYRMQSARQALNSLTHAISRLPQWIDAIFAAALCVAAALSAMETWHSDLHVTYLTAGDAGATQYMIKTVLEHGW